MNPYVYYSNYPITDVPPHLNPTSYYIPNLPVYYPGHSSKRFLGLDFGSKHLWQGLVLGAGLTLILSQEKVQRFILKALAQSWIGIVSGIEEIKEKFEDVKQEITLKGEQEGS